MTNVSRLPRRLTFSLLLTAVLLASGGVSNFAAQEATPADTPCLPQSAIPGDVAAEMTSAESWTELADMPRPRSEVGAAAIDGTIYVVGGFGGTSMLDCYHTASAPGPSALTFRKDSIIPELPPSMDVSTWLGDIPTPA